MAGKFITLEGGDGVGKTTQFELVAQALERAGHSVVRLHEPGGTRAGEKVREILLDAKTGELDPLAELMLFEAARAQIVAEVIQPALDAGSVVLCDRFADSTLAYQGFGRDLGMELCGQLNRISTRGLEPDITLLLTMDGVRARQRVEERSADGAGDRMERAGDAFRQRVEEGFACIAAQDPERVVSISAEGTPQEVNARILEALQRKWPDLSVGEAR